MIHVAVVEDDVRLQKAVAETLAFSEDCRCCGIFSDGASAIERIPALAPDVILMDINLPDMSGVQCVAQIAPKLPQTEVIMLTVFQDPAVIFQALAAGAHGYLVKPVMPQQLLDSIRAIRTGEVPMSSGIARQVVEFFKSAPTAPENSHELSGLGAREQQVLEALVKGLTYKEIASELLISISTVATYVRRIYEKLHVSNRREIIARFKGTGN